jgi:Transcription antiterminator
MTTELEKASPHPLSPVRAEKSVQWVALWTRPRSEKMAARHLESRAIPCWLPTMTVRRKWSDRWKDVELALFPSYLFAEVPLDDWAGLLRTRGVLTVVKSGGKPAWIKQSEMKNLRDAVERCGIGEFEIELVKNFELGDRVRVTEGHMAGLVGVVREVRGVAGSWSRSSRLDGRSAFPSAPPASRKWGNSKESLYRLTAPGGAGRKKGLTRPAGTPMFNA